MNEERQPRLDGLRRDLDRLTREADELADTLQQESRLAREESVGAEILATRDLVAHFGILWDTVDQLGNLAGRQARHFALDYAATLSELTRPAGGAGTAVGNHLDRRLTHIAEGFGEALEVMSRQSEKACGAAFALWSPFFSVVRQDWTGRRRGPNA